MEIVDFVHDANDARASGVPGILERAEERPHTLEIAPKSVS